LKEKAINANELKNVSGGSVGTAITKYQIKSCIDPCVDYGVRPPCLMICRHGAIYGEWNDGNNNYKIDPYKCIACGMCATKCRYGRINKVRIILNDN
jgi:Fe-S-cluster-containing hydrogenase component 2